MKKLILLLLLIPNLVMAEFNADAAEADAASEEEMICHIVSIEGLSEQHQKNFNMKNGPVKGTEHEYSISIMFDEDRLAFENLGNSATMSMNRISGSKEENKKNYENIEQGGWYSFGLKNNNKDFLFSVAKANYAADYLGNCEVVK